jgi:sugar phosphate isomerase/epimerase
MKLAEFYEAPRIRIFSYYMPPGEDPALYRDETMRRMSVIAQLAAERGVTLLLENEKGIFGDTAVRVLDILETVNSPSLSHAFDPANYVEIGQSIDAAWNLLRARVTHFHIKDYDPQTERNVPAGTGAGQIPRLLAEAVADGYEGFVVLEPHLVIAELAYGFTGPERFGDAVRALKGILEAKGIAYA